MKSKVLTFVAVLTCLNAELPAQITSSSHPDYHSLTQIAGDGKGVMFALNPNGQIFAWNKSKWAQIQGLLKQISVGSPDHVWGVNANNEVWQLTRTAGWIRQPGTMTHIAVPRGGGAVAAIDTYGRPYQWDGTKWNGIPYAPALAKIEIGRPGNIWGLAKDGRIYQWMPRLNYWRLIPGTLKTLSVAADGSIGGLNFQDKFVVQKQPEPDGVVSGSPQPEWVTLDGTWKGGVLIDAATTVFINQEDLLIQRSTSDLSFDKPVQLGLAESDVQVLTSYETTSPYNFGTGWSSPYQCSANNSAVYMGGVNLCLPRTFTMTVQTSTGSRTFKPIVAVPGVSKNIPMYTGTNIIGLVFNLGSYAGSLDWIGNSPANVGQKQIVCDPRHFRSVSNHSWVEFRLPRGSENDPVWIGSGAHNKYVFPACNRVWWYNVMFTCNATTGWRLTNGVYDADGLCHGTPGSSPYVVVGDR